jgi:hypothetical protein
MTDISLRRPPRAAAGRAEGTDMISAEWVAADGSDARRVTRRAVSFAAFVTDTGATAQKVAIVDLSAQGCRLTGTSGLEAGAEIWLKLSGSSPHRTRIVWTDGETAGCEFCTPIDPWLLDSLISKPAVRRKLFGGSVV